MELSCLFLFFLSVLSLVSSAVPHDEVDVAPWTPVDWRTLPKANPDDKVQVLYLVAPLLEEDVGNLLKDLDLFHGALAFNNLRTNFSITVNYDADDFFRASLFPEIKQYDNGTKYLVWDNLGANFIYLGINWTYWDAGTYVVAEISGDLYNTFLSTWNANLNQSQPYYNMFGIMEKFGGKSYVKSWDCFDFAWNAFNFLYANGGTFNDSVHINRNVVNFYTGSNAPLDVTKLYNTDPDTHNEIIDFYEVLGANIEDVTFWEIILTVFDAFDGYFFIRSSSKYYEAQLMWPFVGLDWVYAPLPGQT